MQVVEAKQLWLGELATGGASRWTIRNYDTAVRRMLQTLAVRHQTDAADVVLEKVGRDDVVAALAEYAEGAGDRRPAQSTLATYATALRAFFSWCVETEKLTVSPMLRIRRPKAPIRVPRAMDAAQCRRLVEAAAASRSAERDTLMLLMGLALGLRLAEIASVRPADFRPSAGEPTHLRIIGKGNKERLVPVPKIVRDALETWLPVREARLERRWLEVSSSGLRIRLSRRLAEPPAEIPWDAIIWLERDSATPLVRTDGQPRRRGVSRWRVFDRTVLYLNPAKTTPQLVRVTIGDFDFDLSGVGLINLLRQVHVGFAGAAVDIAAGNYLREGRKCEPWNGEAWTYDEADAAEQKLKARLPGPVYLLYRIFGALFGLVTVVALLAVLLLTS